LKNLASTLSIKIFYLNNLRNKILNTVIMKLLFFITQLHNYVNSNCYGYFLRSLYRFFYNYFYLAGMLLILYDNENFIFGQHFIIRQFFIRKYALTIRGIHRRTKRLHFWRAFQNLTCIYIIFWIIFIKR